MSSHSMPTNVPLVPGIDNVPRTPRTPRGTIIDPQDPRFYPVVKDGTKPDPQVSVIFYDVGFWSMWHWYKALSFQIGSLFRVNIDPSCVVCVQTPCKRKTRYSENPPVEGHVGWVIDSKDHVTTASSTTVSELTAPITVSSGATGTRYVTQLA